MLVIHSVSGMPGGQVRQLGVAAFTFMKVFVSYRRRDSSYLAEPIRMAIDGRFGEGSAFLDTVHIESGADYRQRLERAIREADCMLVLIGPNWQVARLKDDDDPVRYELLTARERNLRVIPAVHSDEPMPTRRSLPRDLRWLADINAFVFTSAQKASVEIGMIVDIIGQPSPISAAPLTGLGQDSTEPLQDLEQAETRPAQAVAPPNEPESDIRVRFKEAIALGEQGDAHTAQSLLAEVFEQQSVQLGFNHPETLASWVELLYWESKTFGGVVDEKLLQRATVPALQTILPTVTKEFGDNDRFTLHTRFVLAEALGDSGEHNLAIRSLEVLIPDQTKALGRKDADTHRSRLRLAHWLSEAGRPAQAAKILSPLVVEQQRKLSSTPASRATQLLLGRRQAESGDFRRARKTLKSLLSDQHLKLTADDPAVLETRFWLACTHLEDGDTTRGAAMLAELFDDQRRTLGDRHPDTQRTSERLANL